MEEKVISKAVISRLPRYYRYLEELKAEGVERISSKELSERMQVTASQIRQDLNNFGGFGQQGYGYNVAYLHETIGKLLCLDKDHPIVIVGIGNIGRAMAEYLKNREAVFYPIGLFDKDPERKGQVVADLPIRGMDELKGFLSENPVDIGIIAVPKENAQEVAEELVNGGIKAIWNFALIDLNLNLPDDVVVENVHLLESLMRLSYNLDMKEKK